MSTTVCRIIDCDAPAEDGSDQCKECMDTYKKLSDKWKEKTEELIIDEFIEEVKGLNNEYKFK